MPTTAPAPPHPVYAHIIREHQGPGAPDILNLRMPRPLLQRYSAMAMALKVDRATLLRLALVHWMETEGGAENALTPL
jgi:hypothetical protein